MHHRAKAFMMMLLAMSCSIHAAELESLQQFIKKKPTYLSDKNDVEMMASRCSALYVVLSARAEEASSSKELKGTAKEYTNRALVFDEVREIFSKVTDHKLQSSTTQQKEFGKIYADMTLMNWKQSGDLFKGIVNEDLDVCRDHYFHFKKLSVNLSKDIKK